MFAIKDRPSKDSGRCLRRASEEVLYAVVLSIGGAYDFRHCTIGNYWSEGIRQTPSLVLNNYYKDIYGVWQIRELYSAYFGNCIIYGNIANELLLDSYYHTEGIQEGEEVLCKFYKLKNELK